MAQLPGFFEARFGGLRLWASEVTTTGGRDVAVHKLSRGNIHPKQDRGAGEGRVRMSLQFDEMLGDDLSGPERLAQLEELISTGEPQVFQHPLAGVYLARAGVLESRIGGDSVITADFELHREEEPRAVQETGFATGAVDDSSLDAAADGVAEQLDAIGVESDVVEQAKEMNARWQSGSANTRTILTDVAQMSDFIGSEIVRLDLTVDLSKWQAYRAMILMSAAMLSTARTLTAEVSQVFTMKIAKSMSLNTLLAHLYGADNVEEYRAKAKQLNDIRTTGWLTVGTSLRLPVPPRTLARQG